MSYFDSFIIFFLTLGMTSLKCFINFAFTQVLGLVDNGSMQCNLISKLSWRAGSIERLEGRRNCQIIVSKEDSANGFEMPLHFQGTQRKIMKRWRTGSWTWFSKSMDLLLRVHLMQKDHLSLEHLSVQISFSYLSFNNDIRI